MMNSARILISTAMLFLVLGCTGNKQSSVDDMQQAFADARSEVTSVVADQQRAERANELLTRLEQGFLAAQKEVKQRKASLRTLNANYDASRAEFDVEMVGLANALAANQRLVADVQQQLVDTLSSAEWAAIEKSRSKAIESMLAALQAS
jgi:UDP-N-acetylmuramyl tripeptide synthase